MNGLTGFRVSKFGILHFCGPEVVAHLALDHRRATAIAAHLASNDGSEDASLACHANR